MTSHSFTHLTQWARRLMACCAGALIVGASASVHPNEVSGSVTERQVYLMGTRATLTTRASSRVVAVKSLDRMLAVLESTERELSTWRDDSLLTQLNRQPIAEPWPAPESLCDLLVELTSWSTLTAGAFDPAVGSLIDLWDLRGEGRLPLPAAVETARERAGIDQFVVRGTPCSVTRLADVAVDAGGFGKGVALDRVASLDESGLVDLGGQVAVLGESPSGGWPVHIAHPSDRDTPVVELGLTRGSLAVSGGSERDRWVDGQRVGHVVDPRTGMAVSRPWSVAVWHERALAADVIATALYVMGLDEGRAWAEANDVAACFLVPRPEGGLRSSASVDVVATRHFRRRFL